MAQKQVKIHVDLSRIHLLSLESPIFTDSDREPRNVSPVVMNLRRNLGADLWHPVIWAGIHVN